jgi:hypothetical protein
MEEEGGASISIPLISLLPVPTLLLDKSPKGLNWYGLQKKGISSD